MAKKFLVLGIIMIWLSLGIAINIFSLPAPQNYLGYFLALSFPFLLVGIFLLRKYIKTRNSKSTDSKNETVTDYTKNNKDSDKTQFWV